jgi:hypothetical protein
MYSWFVEPIQLASAQSQYSKDAVFNEALTIALLSPDDDEQDPMDQFYDNHSSYALSWEFQSFWEREMRDFWYQFNQPPPKDIPACVAACTNNYEEMALFCGFAAGVALLVSTRASVGTGAVCLGAAYLDRLRCRENCFR